jgi:hypothetical protein
MIYTKIGEVSRKEMSTCMWAASSYDFARLRHNSNDGTNMEVPRVP